jgi:hypothetical protein
MLKPTMPLADNAGHQARLKAGARYERTLEGVGSMPVLGAGDGRDTGLTCLPHSPGPSLSLGPRTSVTSAVGELATPCPCSSGPSPSILSAPASTR